MCNWCNEIQGFGHMGVGATRPRLREAQGCCIFYIESCRQYYNEVRGRYATEELQARPKRDPDDPYSRLEYGEGLLSSVLSLDDYKDWYYLSYMPSWRRRVYIRRVAGKGACAPEERVRRGVEDETNGWPKQSLLEDFK